MVSGEEKPVFGGVAEVLEDAVEAIPVPCCRGFGGDRQALDGKVNVWAREVGYVSQVTEYLLVFFQLGVF